jgi:hypothetical protein
MSLPEKHTRFFLTTFVQSRKKEMCRADQAHQSQEWISKSSTLHLPGSESVADGVNKGIALALASNLVLPGLTKACSGRAISVSLMQGLSLAAVRARR